MLPLALTTLTLVLTDVQALPLDSRLLRGATESALAGSGVRLHWDAAPAGPGLKAAPERVCVILLDAHPRRTGSERVLGAVFRERGPTSAIWIYVGELRRLLESPRAGPRAPAVDDLSVAVGRVLAHEVAHLLAPEHPHAADGLMAQVVSRKTLGKDAPPLDDACIGAIRLAIAASSAPPALAGLPSRGLPGVGSSEAGVGASH